MVKLTKEQKQIQALTLKLEAVLCALPRSVPAKVQTCALAIVVAQMSVNQSDSADWRLDFAGIVADLGRKLERRKGPTH